MKLKILFAGVVLLAFVLGGSSADKIEPRRERTFNLDVATPINKITTQLVKFLQTLQLNDLLKLILKLWTNCLAPLIPTPFAAMVDFSKVDLADPKFQQLVRKIKTTDFGEIDLLDISIGEEPFCNSTEFRELHKFIWVTDDQAEDLMKFLYIANFPAIYDTVETLYSLLELIGCKGLGADIPTRPEPTSLRANPLYNNKLPNVRQQFLDSLHQVDGINAEEVCNLIELFQLAKSSGLIDLISLLDIVIHELNTNPSLHFLVGKIAEPVKGKSFRELRLLPPVRKFMKKLHNDLIANPDFNEIFQMIKDLLQLDFFLVNPVDLIISLFEFVIWGTPWLPPDLSP